MRFDAALVTLNRLADVSAQDDLGDWLEDEGLILHDRLAPGGYSSTPTNTVAFASTGGDGVHFSLVDLGDGPSETSPVVMTVPMALGDDLRPNWIVGESLPEFLALGLHGGWFGLEQLAYDPARPGALARAASVPPSPAIDRLAAALDLHPWPDVEARLADLQLRVAPVLHLSRGGRGR
ncbi:MAG TPA: hypothetical protein VF228_00070 [Iamia sp.]